MPVFSFAVVFLASCITSASLQTLELSTKEKIPPLRRPNITLTRELGEIKTAFAKGNFKDCFKKSQSLRKKASEIEPWVVLAGLVCAEKGLHLDQGLANDFFKEIKSSRDKTKWFNQGPYATDFRNVGIKGLLHLANASLAKDRKNTWGYIDALFEWLQYLESKQRATYFRIVGDLAFLEQKWPSASEYYKKSLALDDNVELRKKFDQLEEKRPPQVIEPIVESSNGLSVFPELLELDRRMKESFKNNNLGAAILDAAEIVKKYPDTKASEFAGVKLIETLFMVLEESETKFEAIREKLLDLMEDCTAQRVSRWSKLLYGRGQYAISHRFAKRAAKKLDGLSSIVEELEVAALSAQHIGQLSDAITLNNVLIEKYPSVPQSNEALFRLGLIYLQRQEYSQSASSFEKYLLLTGTNGKELNARYWRYRALQFMKNTELEKEAEIILEKFPFSYYGILLRSEKDPLAFSFVFQPETEVKAPYWLIGDYQLSWKRLNTLLEIGWNEEAQAELKYLPSPVNALQKVVLSRYFVAAQEYASAIKFMNEAWDENKMFRQKSFLTMLFPNDFLSAVTEFAAQKNIESDLILSLIRQESAFSRTAVSRSGALGLMQLIPPTADEVAKDLNFQSLNIPDEVFQPKLNIQMGTHYLAKMLKKYRGHVPLALASYNAGPTRLDRWLNAKGIAKKIREKTDFDPMDDLWVEELPWGETSFYVKSILRNLVIYRSLKAPETFVLKKPVWKQD
ncbi:MAG: transglycosylase SLT domain-containing protein [Pseudomonadota bacterium]|nr:transglycosylase SLT domain-containing protein [Pseudomonadota bacterium]